MMEIDINADGALTEKGQEQVRDMMSDVAQKVLIALTTLKAEDFKAFTYRSEETENVKKVQQLLEDVLVEADIPAILAQSLPDNFKLVHTLVMNIGNAFANAQNVIALDAMGKKKEVEVSTKDVRDAYNKVVAKRVQEAAEVPAPEAGQEKPAE